MSEREAILFANTAFYAAFAARDYDAMEGLWAKEGEIGCVHPGWIPIKGRKAVMTSWRNILGNPESPEVSTRKPIVLLHGTSAVVVCLEVIGERGGQKPQVLSATNVFVKEKDGWRIAHHHAGIANVDVSALKEEERPALN